MKIQILYVGEEVNEKLDAKVTAAMKSIGAEWYAQGFDLSTGVRDINFDIVEPKKK